jgi:hypothetical protein
MKSVALTGGLAALVCGGADGCVAQPPSVPAGNAQPLNPAISSAMTCGELLPLLKSTDHTGGLAILWLDGLYSGRSGLTQLPAGWVRTVSQGIGGTCAITLNASRPVLDVIGELHREYGGPEAATSR